MALKQRGHSYDAYDDCLNVKTSTLWVKLKIERAENNKKKHFILSKIWERIGERGGQNLLIKYISSLFMHHSKKYCTYLMSWQLERNEWLHIKRL